MIVYVSLFSSGSVSKFQALAAYDHHVKSRKMLRTCSQERVEDIDVI